METKYLLMHILDVHTAAPFKDLFIIKPSVLGDITAAMRKSGYDNAFPIVLWAGHGGIVVDGHTRLQAAKDAGLLDVAVVMHDFPDELGALEYAIACQRNRRNLTDGEMLACLAALDERKKVGRPEKTTSNEVISGRTSQKTADLLGTSATKVEKLRVINAHATPEIRDSLTKGDISVNRAYNETMQHRRAVERHIPDVSPEDVKRERLKALEESIVKIVAARIEREIHEYPEIAYKDRERRDLIARCVCGITAAMENLPLEKNDNDKGVANNGDA